ncbi:MAG: tRNA pseudouridine synthase [Chitinophagaceae bacterium]|nr:tRNA pseudouridine synthase [Chitinophagaceae bacterium]
MKQKAIHPAMQSFLNGDVILIDKPLHWTSFDAVKKVRMLTGVAKVGHAGTLDPLATGLLIMCTGKFTKKINEYMGMEKEYTGSFSLGSVTPTYDLESEPINHQNIDHITNEEIISATQQFIGLIKQVPPIYSAIKKDGKAAYLSARQGEEIIMEPRPVTIKIFEITGIALPQVYFKIVCSPGTYIRSIANDFGEALHVGAHLSSLRRTRIGEFSAEKADTIKSFEEKILKMKSEGQSDS